MSKPKTPTVALERVEAAARAALKPAAPPPWMDTPELRALHRIETLLIAMDRKLNHIEWVLADLEPDPDLVEAQERVVEARHDLVDTQLERVVQRLDRIDARLAKK